MDLSSVAVSLKLASVVTLILMLVCTPLAWWLSQTRSKFKPWISALLAMPLVLPPTVLGFYLLLLMSPQSFFGQFYQSIGLGTLPFSFTGIVIACTIHSLPFVVQPLQSGFEAIGREPLEAAATLRAGPIDRFFKVILPLAKPSLLGAAILGFCHTLGEFGVVLMIGGNIQGSTRVMSVDIYNHVEALDYASAHVLAGGLVAFSFFALLLIYGLNQRSRLLP
ncbi:molybdate ABC transporter permease subunit [Alginatibacterium sediminis]|uniref:Molybdenum transport system permease n=1 Tax=Alginatibacterium sediminis TaxID=2164068 RepID=A0A420EB25_9ALTE|nr:molybdate ABC transporter permease subunit [Alginatibacterium sediminis]RKF17853.1 molybdate ABC transporter permease subunit [Alginatibacterium sediminis]